MTITSSASSKYRSRSSAQKLIGLSVSYDRDHLLARGLGLEHLKELMIGLARPLLRQGANIAYGGHWNEADDNFTYDLLRLISAEQEDSSLGGPDTNLVIGRLYNHSSWPNYLQVTPRIEAQWIHCCRIVRITQEVAGIADGDRVADERRTEDPEKTLLNSAIALSAMRRLVNDGMSLVSPALPTIESVPPISARVLLGGKASRFSGFLPGLFEEASLVLDRSLPLYILGGFGGAAEVLAMALLAPAGCRPLQFEAKYQVAHTPALVKLNELAAKRGAFVTTTAAGLDVLHQRVETAKASLAERLKTGLTDEETRELLLTRDMRRAVQLVLAGLKNAVGLQVLPA